MIVGWKVIIKYSYNEIVFVFDNVGVAVDFASYAMTHYNKEETGDNKDLYVSMKPIMEEEKGEEE